MIPEEDWGKDVYFGGGGSASWDGGLDYYCRVCMSSDTYEHETVQEFEIGIQKPVMEYCTVTGAYLDLSDFDRPSKSDMEYVYKSLGVKREA